MAIRIVNNHYHKNSDNDIYIARPGIFGNPWCHIESTGTTKTETREEAIKLYMPYFVNQYKTDPTFKEVVDDLVEVSKTNDINLVCWCVSTSVSEKGCHGYVIKKFIEHKLKEQKK